MNPNTPDITLIRDRLTALEESFENLSRRLETICLPARVKTEEAASEPPIDKSHVRGRLERLIEQVSDLQQRLEL
jgi:hypothetical protein